MSDGHSYSPVEVMLTQTYTMFPDRWLLKWLCADCYLISESSAFLANIFSSPEQAIWHRFCIMKKYFAAQDENIKSVQLSILYLFASLENSTLNSMNEKKRNSISGHKDSIPFKVSVTWQRMAHNIWFTRISCFHHEVISFNVYLKRCRREKWSEWWQGWCCFTEKKKDMNFSIRKITGPHITQKTTGPLITQSTTGPLSPRVP